jgi:rare lipoprotein A
LVNREEENEDMQTKLRVTGFVVVASLLWITPTFAGSPRAQVQGNSKMLKNRYIGTASWYGETRQGRIMANSQRFDRHKFTAASWYYPLGTMIRVVNVKNGESVVVKITDRGPALHLQRVVDLSEVAAERLGYVGQGLTPVFVYPLTHFETESASFDSGLVGAPASQVPGEYEANAIVKPM